jgi:hypothetical protein
MISNENKKEYEILDLLKEKNLKTNKIISILKKTEFKLKYHKKYFEKMMKEIKPKIIFFRTGYYGGMNAYYIKWAKEMGIKTAEFQHGSISKNHESYNYGEAILNSKEYKKYVPDYFLTYGDYWNREIRIPGKTYTIGNPHFHESVKNYKNIKEEKDTIMIVSQGTLTKEFVNIAENLAIEFPNKRIIFKLHPGEISFIDRYISLNKYKNIEIKKDGDIYELLAKYENIVACYSTTVFEALAFNKNIYILDNDYSKNNIPKNIGLRFRNIEELISLIKNKTKNEYDHDIEYYFNSNWKENYKRFIKEEAGINIDD